MICGNCFKEGRACRCNTPLALSWYVVSFVSAVIAFLIFGLTTYSIAWAIIAWVLVAIAAGSYFLGKYSRG